MTVSSTSTATDGFGGDRRQEAEESGDRLTLCELAERRLIRAAQGGDEDAFRALVEQNADAVFRFCMRFTGCREDALDISQDVFIRAHRALPRFKQGKARLSTWLTQIALNRCRDCFKSSAARLARRSGPISTAERQLLCETAGPDESAQLSDDCVKLRQGLASVGKRHAEVLVLAYLQEMSHAECADVLRCSVRGVEGRLHRARRALSDWWKSCVE